MGYLLNIEKEKIQKLKIVAAREGTTIRKIIETQVDEYIRQHLDSDNPQTIIENFDRETVAAIPQLYETNTEKWEKFFKYGITNNAEYHELDTQIRKVVNMMNEKFKDLNPVDGNNHAL